MEAANTRRFLSFSALLQTVSVVVVVMDNESYNICLDLVEWFESVCQTVPNFELSRSCFYVNGKTLRVASPGVLRASGSEESLLLGDFAQSGVLRVVFV